MIQPSGETRQLVVYGAGGHGAVVADSARAAGLHVLGFLDDHAHGPTLAGDPVLPPDDPRLDRAGVIVAIGDNTARQQRQAQQEDAGRTLVPVVHPHAWVSPRATVEAGAFVGPGAVVNAQATVGRGAIVNSGAIVEHDGWIDRYAHLAPGAVLGGGVSVGQLSFIGLGARVLPGVAIGEACIVGAGAVVIRDVPDGQRVAGVPAKPIGG